MCHSRAHCFICCVNHIKYLILILETEGYADTIRNRIIEVKRKTNKHVFVSN